MRPLRPDTKLLTLSASRNDATNHELKRLTWFRSFFYPQRFSEEIFLTYPSNGQPEPGEVAVISIEVAREEEVRKLSSKLLAIMADTNSQVYRENVAKFGIPEEYVREAFSEESLLSARTAGNIFYIASEDDDILGFGQIVPRSKESVELDRIIIFPESTRRGIGTKLLHEIERDQKNMGITKIIVRTGKEELHARSFYEKNFFKETNEIEIDAPWGGELTLVQYELEL